MTDKIFNVHTPYNQTQGKNLTPQTELADALAIDLKKFETFLTNTNEEFL